MAGDVDVKQLLLQVDASVELLRKNLGAAEQRVAGFEKSVKESTARSDAAFGKLGTGLVGIRNHLSTVKGLLEATFAAAAAAGISSAVKGALDYASALGETAQQLGVTTKELQEYRYAATQVGIEQETMDAALAKLTKTMGMAATGGKAQSQVFETLGISLRDASGDMKTAGEIIPELAEALANVSDPARRAAVETELFGKAGQKLDTLLAGGSDAVNELRRAAYDLGIVLSDQDIQSADQTADKLAELNQVLSMRVATAVSQNAQSIYGLANALTFLSSQAIKTANDYPKAVSAITGAALGGRMGGWMGAAAGAGLGFLTGLQLQQNQDDANMDRQFRATKLQAAKDNLERAKRAAGSPRYYQSHLEQYNKQVRLYNQSLHAADAPPAPKPGEVPDLSQLNAGGGGGGRSGGGSSGPSAAEIEKQFNDQLAGYTQQALSAQEAMARSLDERAEMELRGVELTRIRSLDDIAANKNYSETQRERLRLQVEAVATEERSRIEFRRQQDAEREAADLAEETFRTQMDALRDQYDLADSVSERGRIAQEIIDLDYRYRAAMLDAVIASETASKEDQRRAEIAKGALADRQASAKLRAANDSAGPGASYLRQMRGEAEDLGYALENVAVKGLEDLNDTLAESAKNALGLHGILGDIVGDLIEIAIRQAVIQPLASGLFGGGGGGIGGFLGSVFGGFRESGGPVSPGRAYVVGEKRPELFVPRVPGVIVPNVPTAANDGGGGMAVNLTVNAPGATAETVSMIRRELAAAVPQIVQAATANTKRDLGRKRLR